MQHPESTGTDAVNVEEILQRIKFDSTDVAKKAGEHFSNLCNIDNQVFIDFETYYDDDYNLSKKTMNYAKYVTDDRFKVHTMQIAVGNGPIQYLTNEEDIKAALERELTPGRVLVAQRAFFDCLIVEHVYGIRPDYYMDLEAISRARRPSEMFHNLAIQSRREFPDNSELWKLDDDALKLTFGQKELTPYILEQLKPYAVGDITSMRALWNKYVVEERFPSMELYVIHMFTRNYVEKLVVADIPLLRKTEQESLEAQAKAIDEGYDFLIENADLPASFWVTIDDRDKEVFKSMKSYTESYERAFGFNKPLRNKSEIRKLFSAEKRFAYILKHGFGIEPPMKDVPGTERQTFAFGKDDVAFQHLMSQHRDLEPIWRARTLSKSNQAHTRAVSMRETAECFNGRLPMPLKASAAHTHRAGGTEDINMQNMSRNSNHRLAVTAPEGYVIMVRDSSNIESRLSAEFCDNFDRQELFARGGDPYNETGTQIFGYKIDRKSKEVDHSIQGAIAKATDLGCGYGMGKDRFRDYLNGGPLGMKPIFLEDVPELAVHENPYDFVIKQYRGANSAITDTWRRLQRVIPEMTHAVTDFTMNCGIRVLKERIVLPSGLELQYPWLGTGQDGWSYRNNKNTMVKLFGGKLLENIIQALARILIFEQMVITDIYLTMHDLGRVILQVHDEIIALVKQFNATRKESAPRYTSPEMFNQVQKDHYNPETKQVELYNNTEILDYINGVIHQIMCTPCSWAPRLVLNSEGGYDYCYSK